MRNCTFKQVGFPQCVTKCKACIKKDKRDSIKDFFVVAVIMVFNILVLLAMLKTLGKI